MIREGKDVRINVVGSSMQPFLYNGDQVVLSEITLVDIKLGDVVLGKYRGSFVLHRVIKKETKSIIMAGDNNLVQLEEIDETNIIAVAKVLVRGDKEINLRASTLKFSGLVWYLLRPFRKVYRKISEIIN